MKSPKILIRIGFVLLVAVAVLLVVRAVFDYVGGRALIRTLAGLKAKGVPLTAADLAAPCPDEDNGARLWKAAENLLVFEEPPKRPQITPLDVRATGRSALPGAFMRHVEGGPIDPAQRAKLQDLASRNVRVFELMSEAGAKPCFLSRDPASSAIESLSPGSAIKMLRATQLLGFSALFAAEAGDVPGALDRIIAGLRFAPRAAEDGTLIMYLVALAGTRGLTYFLQDICRGRKISDDILAQLISELDPLPWRERQAAAVRGERVVFIEAGERTMRGSLKELEFMFGEPSILRNIGVWLVRPVVKTDIRKTLPVYDELEKHARVPYFESRGRLRSLAEQHKKRPWHAFLSKAMVSSFETAYLKEAMLEATILATRTGLACRLYKSRTGEYPENLGVLVPGILSEVPVDPFTGKPFAYRREGAGFIVYSLGSNEKDDGGRSTYNITKLVMERDDDFSWQEPH
jgi:hypothetical protein